MVYYTVTQVATKLNVSERVIRFLIRHGRLPAVRIGKEYRIEAADMAAFLEKQAVEVR